MSSDPEAARSARRAELRRRQLRRRRATGAALLVAVAGIGIWTAATLASGRGARAAGTDSVTTTGFTGMGPTTAQTTTAPVTTAAPAPAPVTATTRGLGARRVTIAWVGDMVLASRYGTPPDGGRLSMTPVTAPLRRADVTFGNLEETLSALPDTKCGSSANCFAFQAPPSYARLMTAAGFDVMNVANNHADDFGTAGERSTERALRRVGLRWTGRPGQITVVRRNGIRIALLGFAPYAWASRLDRVGLAQALVRRAAQRADVVVVAMHAGAEGPDAMHVPHGTEFFLGENRGDSRRFAHAVVDAGADLVVGSGPHVIRGLERYHGRLIAYSLGNFAGYKNFGTGGTLSLSAILSVKLREDGTFGGGTWTSLRLDGSALPHRDPTGASAHLAARLSREDFGASAARIDPDGTIRA